MLIGVKFTSEEVGRLARDFERSEGGLVPRMEREIEKKGREIRDESRRRFIEYAGQRKLSAVATKRVRRSAEGIESFTGILEVGTGVYTTVGQTLPRGGRPNPRWTDTMFGILQNVSDVRVFPQVFHAMEEATVIEMKKNNLM